jgi:hypothetical protein
MTLTALLAAGVLQVATTCAPFSILDEKLQTKYDEQIIGRGVESRGHLMLLYKSKAKSTFTVVLLRNNGMACVVTHGDGWEEIPHQDKGSRS